MHPRIWLNWLVPPLRPSELAVVDVLVNSVDERTAKYLRARVELINFVQRSSDGREIMLYVIRRGKVQFEAGSQVPGWPRRDAIIATAIFDVGSQQIQAKYILVDGQLCSIELSQQIPRTVVPNLKNIRVYSPSDPATTSITDTDLPDEYLQVGGTDGVLAEGYSVIPRRDVYSVSVDGTQYIVLAEILDKGMIGVEKARSEKGYFFLSYEGHRPSEAGSSFMEAIKTSLG